MASDLLSIAKSGAKTARTALDVTAQNIANASSEGYIRRSVALKEVSAAGGFSTARDVSLSGVRLDRVVRNADMFRQSEVRRTGSDSARATAEVAGLENIESAIEQSNVYTAIVEFEAALQRLTADPVDSSLRAAAVEDARTMTRTFNIASNALDAVGESLRFEATEGVSQVNTLATELSRVNLRLARAADSSSDQATLLDQRDALLERLSQYTDVTTTFAADQTVEVRLGGASGPQLVGGGTATPLSMTTATNGTVAFAIGATPVTLAAGSLTGKAQALTKVAAVRTDLDAIAASVITTANTAQAAGVALDGTAGQPFFSGSGAGNIGVALTSGSELATAPAGAGANSRDAANLEALRATLGTVNPAGEMDGLLFDISSNVAGRTITRDALISIAGQAKVALQARAGVVLDNEAENLRRYQQAFQANGSVMQVAADVVGTLLGIR